MKPRILKVTGTYGTEAQNGVGRFLSGLQAWSAAQELPLHVFSSGDHLSNYSGVRNIHAMTYPIPGGFQAIEGYYPLEGRRKQLARAFKAIDPEIVHISTPEALGMTGQWIARRQHRLLSGIYHTDFPSYAQRLVADHLTRIVEERGSLNLAGTTIAPVWNRLQATYESMTRGWERWILGFLIQRILKRNQKRIDGEVRRRCHDVADLARGVVREAMAQFYAHFHLVIARSEVSRRKLIDELFLPEERVRTLKAGVDPTLFSPTPTEADAALRKRLGVPAGHKVLLYVGRVTYEKNVAFLADTWRILRAKQSDITFLLVGSGNLESFSQRAGPGVIAAGALHGAELSAAYRIADLFWTASVNETLGQVVLESLASGLPALVGDRGALCENVRHGETGWILPVDDPTAWAAHLQQRWPTPERIGLMGSMARDYAEDHSIDTSYRHYWELHEELADARGTRVFAGRKTILLSDGERVFPQVQEIGPRTTHLSDFHAGERSRKIPKELALRAACARVVDRGSTLFLHGDFLDTRPPLPKFKDDLAMVRRTLDEFGLKPELYFEGNHDYEFARRGQIPELIGCRVSPSMIHRDPNSGLVLTHGHVSEIPGIQQMMADAKSPADLLAKLRIDKLQEALKVSALQYDVIGVVTNFIERAGLQGLEDAWRHGYDARRWVADRLFELLRKTALDDYGLQAAIHMIGSSDREDVLAQLCASLEGWGLIYGHTHEPHVTKQKVVDPIRGETRTVLLGNSGSFRRKSIPPTWIEGAFPHLELWAYNARENAAELVDRVSLTAEEMRPYLDRIPKTRTAVHQVPDFEEAAA